MKTKVIKKTLRKKINDWLSTISDKNLVDLLKENIIVTGGSIASMYRKEDVNDFDIYLKSREAVLAISRYYAKPWMTEEAWEDDKEILMFDGAKDYLAESRGTYIDPKGSFAIALENLTPDRVMFYFNGNAGFLVPEKVNSVSGEKYRDRYSPLFFSANAITLTNGIQVIIRFYGDAQEIHKNFDFVHATNWYDYKESNLHLRLEAIECLLTGELRYQGSKYPLTSIIRIKKFLARGYTITAGEQLKMMFQISLLDLSDVAVLSDQLAGVDVSYFEAIIDMMLQEKRKDNRWKPSVEWIAYSIDVVFNNIEHDED